MRLLFYGIFPVILANLLLAAVYTLLMIGVGFIMTPITAYAMGTVSVTMIAHASPMTITIRSLASSMGGVMLIAVMTVSQGILASFWMRQYPQPDYS